VETHAVPRVFAQQRFVLHPESGAGSNDLKDGPALLGNSEELQRVLVKGVIELDWLARQQRNQPIDLFVCRGPVRPDAATPRTLASKRVAVLRRKEDTGRLTELGVTLGRESPGCWCRCARAASCECVEDQGKDEDPISHRAA